MTRGLRLPTLAKDGWSLRSGEAAHQAHPDSFWIPPLAERRGLQRGQLAKLIFEIEAEDDAGNPEVNGERMWVMVTERIGEHYIGILDNQPATFEASDEEYLVPGAEVPFLPEHVIDIDTAPEEYVVERLAAAPTRRWPRR